MVRRPAAALKPGFSTLPPGSERYRVPGGGLVALELAPGDRVTLVDPEGRQAGELCAFESLGRPVPGALGPGPVGEATGLKRLLSAQTGDGRQTTWALRDCGLEIDAALAHRCFGPDTPAGESRAFQAETSARLLVCAPGPPMPPEGGAPPTDLLLTVQRAAPQSPTEASLPEPLAEPRLDFRVGVASAEAYEVKAGEYIQIIDVAGQQCSDFLAFDARRLAQAVERSLDATTTRTLMGASYPSPGLYARFYDQDMEALVTVVRDTVGRHDTFGLACSARYYEEAGYPGHPNCSDNFNAVLATFDIAGRKGWPALNLFFNSGIDGHNQLFFDEPWSRAGDYVLFQAERDLVCASSACPDDISPANAWQLTDIHVRVYPQEKVLSKGVGFRMTPDAETQLTKETAFHPRSARLTRDFTAYRGYWLPNSYSGEGVIAEYLACRERAALLDLSALRKFEVFGPDAEALLQLALTRDVRRLSVGQVSYTSLCYESGGLLDDGTLFRLGPDQFRWVGGEDYGGLWLRQLAESRGLQAWVKSSSAQLHNLALQGPRSRDILGRLLWTPPAQPSIEELSWFRFTIGRIGGASGIPLVVSRTGYTGELGYEIWCHPSDGPAVWDALWEAGRSDGLAPLGLAALDILRIEAGLVFAGVDFDDQTTPFESGIGFTVPAAKSEDYIGKAGLEAQRASPPRRLVGLEMLGSESASAGDCVHVGREQVGLVTSAARSPLLQKSIALCRMKACFAEAGTEVEVGKLDGHRKRLPARVVPLPFYDPEKTRVRS